MNIETMRLLVAKGLSAEDILEVAETMATPARSAAAERQARYRARKAASDVTRDVTRDGDGVTDPALSRPPNENNSNPPTHTHPVREKPARARGSRLPEDWQPGPLPAELASAVALWPPGAIERELARFRDWAASATGPNAVKSNWQAAWRNWLRKVEDDGRYSRASGVSQTSRGPNPDPLIDMLAAARAARAAEDSADHPGTGDGTRSALPAIISG